MLTNTLLTQSGTVSDSKDTTASLKTAKVGKNSPNSGIYVTEAMVMQFRLDSFGIKYCTGISHITQS